MSNDTKENIWERLFKLWAMICKMVMDGVRDPYKVAEILQGIVDEKVEEIKIYLRRLFSFKLAATRGGSHEKAKEVFNGSFDPNFKNWGIVFDGEAPEREIACDELIREGKFTDFLGKTPEELEKRRIKGSQLLALCKHHCSELRGESYANFFVVTVGDKPVNKNLDNVFVASVYVYVSGRLAARLDELSYVNVWYGDYGLRTFSRNSL